MDIKKEEFATKRSNRYHLDRKVNSSSGCSSLQSLNNLMDRQAWASHCGEEQLQGVPWGKRAILISDVSPHSYLS